MKANTLDTPTQDTPVLDTASAWWLTALGRIERSTAVDPAVRVLQRAIRSLPLGRARGVLRGRPIGHPLHPLLVHVPIGCWLSAAVVDLVPGSRPAATTLTAVGLAGVAPAAIAGWVDWADLPPEEARVGLVHAASNTVAVGCYAVSLTARLRGHPVKGRLWSWAGLAAVGAGGALGGHVAYRRAVGGHPAAGLETPGGAQPFPACGPASVEER
ncbi:DUF2231 domain-containing protein [Streptomyces subrutilus]|uniref:DUF2231 domain-containing protein n=1 Tax=Streptomyces subrutilus TaxID=36818 RepID=A0A1E5PLV5_9ACTN|nr:DUF2231 domain-containing protein [Streptomyces subrutilus]OEJ30504.1 hypothetical protein BGK67_03285 [Streptomyces subrutilus]